MLNKVLLDTCGLSCPMPIIKLKKCLAEHKQAGRVGVVIELLSSDKGSLKDIPAFCQVAKLTLLEQGPICESGNASKSASGSPCFRFLIQA